ncbi:hypothetical protein ACFWF9_02790 [Streptomyces roseolus]|uniref:hypothetical protein n=1 Tax=Streptomyces roseolus TaxID=67358 RepID=UPI003655BEDE
MPDSVPPNRPYSVSEELIEHAALHEAVSAAYDAAQRLARSALVIIAAAVQQILTNHSEDPRAPFDACHLELLEADDMSLWSTGRYWTADGKELTFGTTPGVEGAEMALFGLNEWVPCLDDSNRDTWNPLVTMPPRTGRRRYRLDLVRAAQALSLD